MKQKDIPVIEKGLLCKSASHKRWMRVKALACLVGKAPFLHLAIPVARVFLGELEVTRKQGRKSAKS